MGNEQKAVIANQSSLLDELGSHLSRQAMPAPIQEVDETDKPSLISAGPRSPASATSTSSCASTQGSRASRGGGNGGSDSGMTQRRRREAPVPGGARSGGGNPSINAAHARAPRPNSAGLGRGGTTPRARSLSERGNSGHSARGPSPTRSPDSGNGYHQVSSRKPVGAPLPPALPQLRQEA